MGSNYEPVCRSYGELFLNLEYLLLDKKVNRKCNRELIALNIPYNFFTEARSVKFSTEL